MSSLTKEELIEEIKKAICDREYISEGEFQRISGINRYHINRLFPEGGWFEALVAAGANTQAFPVKSVTDEELIRAYHECVKKYQKIPTWNRLAVDYPYSIDILRKRFGGVEGTLHRYYQWLQTNEPSSSIIQKLEGRGNEKHHKRNSSLEMVKEHYPKSDFTNEWRKVEGTEFGEPINFHGLRHAPINEQGVVLLFGMMARELGFEVEAVHNEYPDCEAKRLVDLKKKRWQRVRIEFEYLSHNFVDHGHDPSQCDLIVCWENNWTDCPIEVLELKKVMVD